MTGFYRSLFMAVFLAFMLSAAAQSLSGTTWRSYYKPLTDTVTLRFGADSSFLTSSLGVPILLSTYKSKDDLIIFRDYGGLNACADLPGSYHVKIDSDTLTLVMDEDPCDARGGSLISRRWIRKP